MKIQLLCKIRFNSIFNNDLLNRYMDYVQRCHRDRNMDWTSSEENAAKDVC